MHEVAQGSTPQRKLIFVIFSFIPPDMPLVKGTTIWIVLFAHDVNLSGFDVGVNMIMFANVRNSGESKSRLTKHYYSAIPVPAETVQRFRG
jgi:hypothetical protein